MTITELQDWLRACCDGLEHVVEGVVTPAGGDWTDPVARWSRSGGNVSDELHRALRAALRTGESVISSVQASAGTPSPLSHVISLPLVHDRKLVGAVAVGVAGSNAAVARNIFETLRQACDSLISLLASLEDATVSIHANTALQLQAAVLSRHRLDEAASTFATRLAEMFRCDRVSVGFIEDGCAKVTAVSHGAALDADQGLNRLIAAAMDEAIDQGGTVSFPAPAAAPPRISLAHTELARRQGNSTCSLPIASPGAIVGAVTLERAPDRPLDEREIVLCEHYAGLAGPILALKRENEQPWRSRARKALARTWSRVTGPGEARLKASVAGAALVLAIVFFVPIPYSITAPARIEGSIQRALAAASDGFIEQVAVRPGDAVKDGQVLAQLAQHDLQLERSKWESELAQQVNAYGAALARADRALLMVNHAKVAEARARLQLIENQIERAQIKAPFDGVIISGDLTQSLGAPVRRGEVLMVMAPHERYRLIVEVDERDIADVMAGAAGRITLAALPGQAFAFKAERVAALATTRDGRNFFEVEGKLETGAGALRPGMHGIARIESEERSLARALFHRFGTWLRLQFWSWGIG